MAVISPHGKTNTATIPLANCVTLFGMTGLLLLNWTGFWQLVQDRPGGVPKRAVVKPVALPSVTKLGPSQEQHIETEPTAIQVELTDLRKRYQNILQAKGAISFEFKSFPTAIRDFLPAPPKPMSRQPRFITKLSDVPEVSFRTSLPKSTTPKQATLLNAYQIAKINHLNARKTDAFMIALLKNRRDLHGLPFRLGKESRMKPKESAAFKAAVDQIQSSEAPGLGISAPPAKPTESAQVAALMQMGGPWADVDLAKKLSAISHADAAVALAKLALFALDRDARKTAVHGLRKRPKKDYTGILLSGFQYPWPNAAVNAAYAIIKLERKDLLTELIQTLERPDPRLPVRNKQSGGETYTVRELVRINHLRNCLLCHPPWRTPGVDANKPVVAEVPTEGKPFPSIILSGYGSRFHPDLAIRADITYLRQDFSRIVPVENADSWPASQRFDFVVRTREITKEEAQAWHELAHKSKQRGSASPYKRAAHKALVWLTGLDAGLTALEWRKRLAESP